MYKSFVIKGTFRITRFFPGTRMCITQGISLHQFQFPPCSPKMGSYWDKSMSELSLQRMSCCDLDAHDSNRSLPFFPGNWSESALYCWNYWWHVVQRPRLLPFVCRRRIPPLGGSVALGARAASIDQVGSFKRVIVYGASTPHRGPDQPRM